MYDYWLGGHDNFAADRIAALKIADLWPESPLAARENREFLGRAVRFFAGEAGIRQFIDLGTGLPTRGNVHQVAQAITPGARVVYVDNDPMVLAHARALKTGQDATVIHADLRDIQTILEHPNTARLIDFTQPLAVLFVAVLHFIADPDAHTAVARFVTALAPGSYLALSHVTAETEPADGGSRHRHICQDGQPDRRTAQGGDPRVLRRPGDPPAGPGPGSAMAARRIPADGRGPRAGRPRFARRHRPEPV